VDIDCSTAELIRLKMAVKLSGDSSVRPDHLLRFILQLGEGASHLVEIERVGVFGLREGKWIEPLLGA